MTGKTEASRPTASPGEPTGDAYCNFDHVFEPDAEERLLSGEVLAHTAWGFYGHVWFEGGAFHEEVWIHRAPRRVMSSTDLRGLVACVNDEFGHD